MKTGAKAVIWFGVSYIFGALSIIVGCSLGIASPDTLHIPAGILILIGDSMFFLGN